MKIVVDAMGGDYAPGVVIEGVVQAIAETGIEVALVGIESKIREELKKYNYSASQIEIIHAPQVIDMDDPPTFSIRQKKDSSISIGVNLLRTPGYDAFVSAGNTGAVVCASTVGLRMLPGVERPGIGLVIPTLGNFSFMLDVGANTDAKHQHLLQYAQMAKIYAQHVLGIPRPSIGLLNIGEEETKGTDFEKESYKLLSDRLENFIGNVEANEIFSGKCDCIICDGFVGNVAIKVSESIIESAGALIKREIKKKPLALLGAWILKTQLGHLKKYGDYSEVGGAPLLGVNGIVMISHGRSSSKAIKNAIKAAQREVEHNILSKMIAEVKEKP